MTVYVVFTHALREPGVPSSHFVWDGGRADPESCPVVVSAPECFFEHRSDAVAYAEALAKAGGRSWVGEMNIADPPERP